LVTIYHEEDANLTAIKDRIVTFIGYGNQGRAQALNMRDSGVQNILVGSIRDTSWKKAAKDGFEVYPIDEAAKRGDIILLLVPDEVQPQVYQSHIRDNLTKDNVLVFAHGYNINYGFISPPKSVDVVMLAPRMIGWGVRNIFLEGGGAPAYVAVHQDASGKALKTVLALAKAIGATRSGAIQTSFAEETEIDLFIEQALWAIMTRAIILSFETLVEAGYPPEVVALELYGSGEASEVMKAMAEIGFFKQMSLHSHTSQYGTLSRGPWILNDEIREAMKIVLDEIKTGLFAREWGTEQMLGNPVFHKLKERALRHPINDAEDKMKKLIGK